MFPEDACLPLSALQHLLFCERQCALIHLEGLWAENRLTVEGRHLHERADGKNTGPRGGGRADTRGTLRTVRGLPLCSLELGLIGKADVVEFEGGVPFPVEYKRGRPKSHRADEVQLCAQGLCLEEMLQLGAGGVERGALFYGATRRRMEVVLDAELRGLTVRAAARLHEMIASGVTPRAEREKKCERCSLLHLCLPDAASPRRSASRYVAQSIAVHLAAT